VVESFLKSKKYIVPSAVVSPIFAGCVFAVYVGTGAGRFQPARDALVFDASGTPERPLGREDRLAYQRQLKNVLVGTYPVTGGQNVGKTWSKLQAKAKPDFDEEGRPILQMQVAGRVVRVGASPDNVLDGTAPAEMARHLLEARLQAELRRKSPQAVSESELARDWRLLQQTMRESDASLTAGATQSSDSLAGNRP